MNKIPVFFINGILESGKTTFILDTIRSDGFPGKTLLISCEQGEIEYDEDELSDYKTTLVYFSDVKEFNEANLNRLVRETEADRIVIEFNTTFFCYIFNSMLNSLETFQHFYNFIHRNTHT